MVMTPEQEERWKLDAAISQARRLLGRLNGAAKTSKGHKKKLRIADAEALSIIIDHLIGVKKPTVPKPEGTVL